MASYATNEQCYYTVPSDIITKTLVIFGSDEPAFKFWQPIVENESKRIGFKTQVCLSVDEFTAVFNAEKPDLLIFDCHGGVDMDTKSSYLVLGSERLTGDLIVINNINPPLVFLSACSTAPTYGTINTVANAFFENSTLSVTTTYLPIDIQTSSILYLRLLNNLSYAADKGLHTNWLDFVAHIIRTSAIGEAYAFLERAKSVKVDIKKVKASQTISQAKAMSFSHRRKVFIELDNILQKLSGEDKNIFSNIVPEYLFYSNLGRSDLIKFDSYQEKYNKINNIK